MAEPSSQKPYLLRALYEWCVDNSFTPYIAVTVDANTRVPMEYVRNGEIVLNIGPLAANRLRIGNDFIDFAARFGGVTKDIVVPVGAVAAIYARENGQGMTFEVSPPFRSTRPQLDTVVSKARQGEPRGSEAPAPLREVPANTPDRKGGAADRKAGAPDKKADPFEKKGDASDKKGDASDKKGDDDDHDPKPFGGGRPNLRRVK